MKNKNFDLLVNKVKCLSGEIKAPPSKSYTNRAIIIGGLAGGAKIINPLICDDTQAAVETWKRLGTKIEINSDWFKIGPRAPSPEPRVPSKINVGESGTLLRLILPILALRKGKFIIQGKKSLLKRSNKSIASALKSLGVKINGADSDFRLPIILESEGGFPGGKVTVDGKMSSQVISSLLNISPFTDRDTIISVKGKLVSRPYIDINLDILKQAGIKVYEKRKNVFFIKSGQKFKKGLKFIIHGDYSSATFIMVAACLVDSDITITDLVNDEQGDARIIKILKLMGAKIKHEHDTVRIKGPFELRGIDINCCDTPDLVPILCVAGCFAKGVTRILGVAHLAHKESNRLTMPAQELKKLGAQIKVRADSLEIKGAFLKGGIVSSCGDHRIAMALAVAGLKIGGVVIKGVQCISKSYPDFVRDLNRLGAKLRKSKGDL